MKCSPWKKNIRRVEAESDELFLHPLRHSIPFNGGDRYAANSVFSWTGSILYAPALTYIYTGEIIWLVAAACTRALIEQYTQSIRHLCIHLLYTVELYAIYQYVLLLYNHQPQNIDWGLQGCSHIVRTVHTVHCQNYTGYSMVSAE
jgi:hypothetical protein